MDWEKELKESICSIEELKKYIKLTPEEEKQLQTVVHKHPMRITKYYLSLINKEDKEDPIRRLMIPSPEELNLEGSYDTSGEEENTKTVGLQHKYKQTALILSTNQCAAYCRFCFRKRLVGLPNHEVLDMFGKAVNYIKEHKEINNVLITGGDSLILPTKIIESFLEKLSTIKHLDFIRFGSRIPVVFPNRILNDKALLALLKKYSLKDRRIYVVTHFNHPKEITEESINAIDQLIKSNIIINNQTVLLKGVNDNPETLSNLLNKLVSIGVNPYYVFQCRPVKRVKHHFQIPLYHGLEIVEDAKKKLNGHSKRFKYVMSHKKGKIEIIGIKGDEIYFKYHQAKNPKNIGKLFREKINKTAGWLDELN
ncbi:MAG: KamA family radical SAM protein [Candidatus Aenigmarchaeota archaeon]|nr:KamA family radical SAM protein [Candidatus Aenigmarchaeota archaeon]